MEGKSGINFVLMIIAILFVVVGVAFCVMFGINQTIPGRTYDVAINLYIGLAAIALGAVMLIGCNIATNARITADNSYDTMRYVELLCKKEGITLADLARKDAKQAKKEAEMLARAEAEQQAAVQAAAAAAAPVVESVPAEPVAEPVEDVVDVEPVAPAVQPEEPAQAPEAQPVAADKPLNCGIAYADWRAKLEGIALTCGACGGVMQVRVTKKGVVVLACKDKAENGCPALPFPVDTLAEQFVEWYNGAFDGNLSAFDMDIFMQHVSAISVSDGMARFTAK